jgi:archaellum component FlaG (FlaF/FlaG flagellin family)
MRIRSQPSTPSLPALGSSGSSVLSSSTAASERIKTDIEILVVNSSTTPKEVYVWIKNVGAADVLAIDQADVFVEEVDVTFLRLTYDGVDPLADDTWKYAIQGTETFWKPSTTIKVTLKLATLAAGSYRVRFITNNGVSDTYSFSVA